MRWAMREGDIDMVVLQRRGGLVMFIEWMGRQTTWRYAEIMPIVLV
jgi:Holliday junction resolvase-like predicted endonuclease